MATWDERERYRNGADGLTFRYPVPAQDDYNDPGRFLTPDWLDEESIDDEREEPDDENY